MGGICERTLVLCFGPARFGVARSLREILLAIADDMESPQSPEEQSEKSKGKKIWGDALDRISALHARMRLDSGFNLEQVISEYRALRSSILFLWVRTQPSAVDVDLSEVTRFNETLDQAIAEVVRRYADKSEIYNDVFLGILTHEVRNPLNLIGLYCHVLKSGPLQEAQSRGVERILGGVRSIDRLMNDGRPCPQPYAASYPTYKDKRRFR